MTANNRLISASMELRSWLKLAAFVLIGFAALSSAVLYEMSTNLQSHVHAVHQIARLQAAHADLARSVPRAWLDIETGKHSSAVSALAELHRAIVVAQGITDELAKSHESLVRPVESDAQQQWAKLRASLTGMVEVAAPVVSRKQLIRPAAGPVAAVDQAALENFNAILESSISRAGLIGAQSESSLQSALTRLRGITLVVMGLLVVYGLFVFWCIDYRIRARARDLSYRILQYINGTFSPSARLPSSDEFGLIETQIDECAQRVLGEQMKVARAHQKTLRQLEERTTELSNLNEALKVSGRALVRFLTDVSHDLRTPLAIMVGESEVSLRSQSTSVEHYKETLSRMLEQTKYLSALVDQLLYMARSRISAVPLEPDYIDMMELVEIACRDMKTLADRRDVAIDVNVDIDSCIVLGDPVRLREMMLTILDNAVEYSRSGGTITVNMTVQAPGLVITVSDTGIGIPANELSMVFRRFYRAQNAPGANAHGTGIGLAVAKGIIESHRGTIEIESTENRGTLVTLTLPFVDQSRPEITAATHEQKSKNASPSQLLS